MKKAGIAMSREAMFAKRDELSTLVSVDIWRYLARVGTPKKGGYARINYDKVHPGMGPEWATLETTGCCLAADPYMGATLLNYLNQPHVRKHGIGIRGEAIVRGEHTLYLIVEAIDEARVGNSCTCGSAQPGRCQARCTGGAVSRGR
jgi:hypothetical protein